MVIENLKKRYIGYCEYFGVVVNVLSELKFCFSIVNRKVLVKWKILGKGRVFIKGFWGINDSLESRIWDLLIGISLRGDFLVEVEGYIILLVFDSGYWKWLELVDVVDIKDEICLILINFVMSFCFL